MSALENAKRAARAAHEALYYLGVCDVVEYQDVADVCTKITRKTEVTVLSNQPCNLSFEGTTTTTPTDSAAGQSQALKLFIAPEVTIAAGSKIIVTQNGVTGEYSCSGVPALYEGHQEIDLELFKGWA